MKKSLSFEQTKSSSSYILDTKIDNQLTIIFLIFKLFWAIIHSIARTKTFES